VKALRIEHFKDCMRRLINGETVQMPRYNFKTGLPEDGNILKLEENQILIVEGIHGLNPIMTADLPEDSIFRIFISPMTQVNMDHYNRVSIIDVRLIRRIVRDYRDRGCSAKETIARWESVRNGEDKYINPYRDTADMFINTSLVYELSALKSLAEPALRMVPWGSDEYSDAKRLLTLLEWVEPLDLSLVPANSILSEFVGGSNLADFVAWGA
jgi:uridine kinase